MFSLIPPKTVRAHTASDANVHVIYGYVKEENFGLLVLLVSWIYCFTISAVNVGKQKCGYLSLSIFEHYLRPHEAIEKP